MKKDKTNSIDNKRRSLLKTFAASGISKSLISRSPLIAGMLVARHAEAQAISRPNKSVVIYVPGGAIENFWLPSGSGSNMNLPSMSAGYESVKTECHFLSNMKHQKGGHGNMPRILSSNYNEDTYDVQMGEALSTGMAHQFINLGVHSNGHGILTRHNRNSIPFADNPFTAYRRIFLGEASSAQTPILSVHEKAIEAIQNKLGNDEKHRLDQHLETIHATQQRLGELAGGGTPVPSCDFAVNEEEEFALTYDTFSQQAKLQADIAVAALKCGLTASASIAFGNHQGEFRIPELAYQDSYHQSIHSGAGGRENYPHYVEMRHHLGSLSAYLIKRLSEEGILDETVVVETTDMGNADTHSATPVPYMIAGGGSAIRRGQVSDPGLKPASGGTPEQYDNEDLLVTAAAACGVSLAMTPLPAENRPAPTVIPGVLSTT